MISPLESDSTCHSAEGTRPPVTDIESVPAFHTSTSPRCPLSADHPVVVAQRIGHEARGNRDGPLRVSSLVRLFGVEKRTRARLSSDWGERRLAEQRHRAVERAGRAVRALSARAANRRARPGRGAERRLGIPANRCRPAPASPGFDPPARRAYLRGAESWSRPMSCERCRLRPAIAIWWYECPRRGRAPRRPGRWSSRCCRTGCCGRASAGSTAEPLLAT